MDSRVTGDNGTPTVMTLSNGLKIIVLPVHTAPLVSVWCWYRVGSKDEGPGLTGISHWVEHMNFKGTKNIPRDQMKGLIERFGGMWNGYTWIDQTTYLETATRDALDQMLFLEAERMANGIYDPAACESERTVIISELQGGENDPDNLLDIEVTAAAFKAHPYGHPTIGWIGDLQRITRDELFDYYRRYYVPNNATLVVVGDVQVSEVVNQAAWHFGNIPPGDDLPRLRSAEPEQLAERRVIIRKPGTTAYLKAAFHAPALTTSEFPSMLVLDAVLTGAKGLNLWSSFRGVPPQRSARLYRALVQGGLAATVSGALLPTQEPFLYTISATATEGTDLSRLEDALDRELDRLLADGITPGELEKAKNQLRARTVFENDSVTNLAHQLGYFETVSSLNDYFELPGRIRSCTVAEVNAAAGRFLRRQNRTTGWFERSSNDAG